MGPGVSDEASSSGNRASGDPLAQDELRQRLWAAEAESERLRSQALALESLAAKVLEQGAQLDAVRGEQERLARELERLRASRVVRLAGRARGALLRASSALPGAKGRVGTGEVPVTDVGDVRPPSTLFPSDSRFGLWTELYDTVDDEARTKIRADLAALSDPPLVSVILPVFNPPERYLREAIQSVVGQLYTNWELCIVDDCSTEPWVPKVLAEYAASDDRIRFVRRAENGHISISSNTAVEMAGGTWIALFDHDDVFAEHALALAVLAVAEHPDAGLVYSDEDHLNDRGERVMPYFKPDFDPLLLLGQNYLSHLCMFRRDLVERVGGFRAGYEGSQDWDLVLRVVELLRPEQVVHVPHVLYHWREHATSTASSLAAKPYAVIAGRRCVQDHLDRTGRKARVQTIGNSGFNRIHWEIPDPGPTVSVVVLPRDGHSMIRCLDSIRVRSTYQPIELVVVDDGGHHPPLREYLRDWHDRLNVVRVDGDLSDAALRNAGAAQASGDVVCFLHDDAEVLTDRWMEEMVGLLVQPGIGAVGAKLFYADGRVQHAGIVAGIGGTLGHVHRLIGRLEPGYFGRAGLAQEYSAVSGACVAVRREAFTAVGGFDEEHLSDAFGDADLCFRLREAGWRVAWTPFAELVHHESPTAPRETDGENAVRFAREIRYLQTRWRHVLERDPAYNPNLSLAHETWPLAWPPRASYR